MRRLGDWLSAFLGVGLAIAFFVILPAGILVGLASAVGLPPSVGVLVWGFVVLALAIALTMRVRAERAYRDTYPAENLHVSTDRFAGDTSGEENVNGHPGREFATVLADAVGMDVGGSVVDEVIAEDYGWGFWVRNRDSDEAIWLAVSHAEEPGDSEHDYVLSTSPRSGCNPRASSSPASLGELEQGMQRAVRNWLTVNGIAYTVEEGESS